MHMSLGCTQRQAMGKRRSVRYRIGLVVQALVYRLALRAAKHEVINGLWVGAYDPFDLDAKHDSEMLNRAGDAVRCLKASDPTGFARVQRLLKGVLVHRVPGLRGRYLERLGLCVLDAQYVSSDDASPAAVASTIVHEAAHARLCRRGFWYEEHLRGRIERICTRAQLAFLARVPGQEALAAQLSERLALPDGVWSDRDMRARRMSALGQTLQASALPRPLVRLFQWFAVRRGAA